MAKTKPSSLIEKLKIKKKKGTITKAEEKKLKQLLISNIPGVKYKGSGKDPAVEALKDKLKKDGAGSLDSSGMGTRWKV